MAKREIKIHIAADANLAAIRQINTELAKMAMDVGRKNSDLRQATMLDHHKLDYSTGWIHR